jgi:molybdate transport system substrate-binding protein
MATVRLFAAGSLKDALTDVAAAFEAASGEKVGGHFGPSGLLKDEITGGAMADVFASANMTHPQVLHDLGKSGSVTRFARNTLCALLRPGLNVTSETLLDMMLDPAVKVGTSMPTADPSGDYAFEIFRKAEVIKPGARAALEGKALKLTGAKDSATPPAGRSPYGRHVAEGCADIFLTYRTNVLAAQAQYPDQQRIDLPDELSVGADYGLTVMTGAPEAAHRFAAFIVSDQGQVILARYGFAAANSAAHR